MGRDPSEEAPAKHVFSAAVVLASLIGLGAAGCAGQDKPSDVAGTGWVKTNCGVDPQGRLFDCRIIEESPVGAGFGEAVLKAAANGRLARRADAGARVEFTTRFRLD